jgi:hypothetical protein
VIIALGSYENLPSKQASLTSREGQTRDLFCEFLFLSFFLQAKYFDGGFRGTGG